MCNFIGDDAIMKENWFLLGDIHGDAYPIECFYTGNKDKLESDRSKNHLILLGDVGANFALTGQRDFKFKRELSKYPFTYICLRGNHEARVRSVMERHPEQWEVQDKYGGKVYVEKDFPQIEYLSDSPAVYEFAGYKTLSIPGAYSVDKWYRLSRGWTWYEDEQLTAEEMERGRELKESEQPFDLVISHTCPLTYEPTDLFLPGLDQSMVDTSMERYLDEMEYDLKYRRWAWGHFHADRLYPWNNGKQMLMLFYMNVVDLDKFMKMSEEQSLEDILA